MKAFDKKKSATAGTLASIIKAANANSCTPKRDEQPKESYG